MNQRGQASEGPVIIYHRGGGALENFGFVAMKSSLRFCSILKTPPPPYR